MLFSWQSRDYIVEVMSENGMDSRNKEFVLQPFRFGKPREKVSGECSGTCLGARKFALIVFSGSAPTFSRHSQTSHLLEGAPTSPIFFGGLRPPY